MNSRLFPIGEAPAGTRLEPACATAWHRNLLFMAIAACLAVAFGISAAEAKPLKVFILCGQSNMQGHARVSTLDHLGMHEDTMPLLKAIRREDGSPEVHEDIRIAWLSGSGERTGPLSTGYGADETKIGPELTFGIVMHQQLEEPFLIIKTAWGGKSLHTDFRSPSAGPYEFTEEQIAALKGRDLDVDAARRTRNEATGRYYRLMLAHVKKVLGNMADYHPAYDPTQGFELAGFVWFQGWNDMVDRGVYPDRDQPGGYDEYSKVLAHFIRDVRRDLEAPDLPFVIGVLGVGGPVSRYTPAQQRYSAIHQNFRDAMAAPASMPEFTDTVAAVLTENFWDHQLSELRDRMGAINQQVRQAQSGEALSREEAEALRSRLKKESFTDRELTILDTAISNQEYHYLGSGRIMARIGEGFAKALFSLMD